MQDLSKLKNKAETYDIGQLHRDRKNRLKSLVEIHGVEATATAAGLSVSTLKLYLRASASISENCVRQAEDILGE